MDPECYRERRCIMEIDGEAEPLLASREASDAAYRTRMSRVGTAAANGDWEPARQWCAEVAARFGQDMADGLIGDIDAAIAEKRKL